jgi:polyvinyl alcohol dehydrogenase (cytochrome)
MLSISVCAAADPYAAALFQKNCATCHQPTAGADAQIPPVSALNAMTPPAILKVLETGIMKAQAAPLSGAERRAIAGFLGKAVSTSKGRDQLSNPCPAGAEWTSGPSWSGWGPNASNARFQSSKDAGISAADVPRLTLKWSFSFPDTSVVRSQPAVYRGRIFAGSQDGSVYSLDARTGCTYWSSAVPAPVRSGMTVGEVEGKPVLFFGEDLGSVYALDATSGKELWKVRPDEHPLAKVTATPVFHDGRLYVGVSSWEASMASTPTYACCTFRGSLSALDAKTGKVIWRQFSIPEAATPRGKASGGGTIMGPSGASIWGSPTLDPEHDVIYATTGQNYSDPPSLTSDSVLAFRMSTGQRLWSRQLTANDAWNTSCQLPGKPSCPKAGGPDFDLASSAILISLANGQRALLLGQKSGMAYAVDPDHEGKILWSSRVGEGGEHGGIQWGSTTDGRNVYIGLSDMRSRVTQKPGSNDRISELDPTKGGGMFAFRTDNGELMWKTPPPGCGDRRPCSPAQSAAVTAIPGVVFSGAEDGHLRAYSTTDGKIIWDYDTARDYKTVNGVPGHGGAMDAGGPVVAGGMLFVGSGYGLRGGLPGNVLLAFSIAP